MAKKYLTSLVVTIFMLIVLTVTAQASPNVILNGDKLNFDVPPVIEKGTTLVPLRTIFEAIGATVSWDEKSQTVTAIRGLNTIKLQIGSSAATKNGLPINLDIPAKIVNGITLVPLRFVSEAMGCTVGWVEETHTVVITYNSNFDLNNKDYSDLEIYLTTYIIEFLDSNNIEYTDPNIKNYLEGRIVLANSMIPTISANDRVFINKLRYTEMEPQRGDIIAYLPPVNITESTYLHRIVAVPGDSLVITNGHLYINDQLYHEPYILEPMNYQYGPIKLPADNYFVLGDNRNSSYDSHLWSNMFVPKSNIIGKAECIYWPSDHRRNL